MKNKYLEALKCVDSELFISQVGAKWDLKSLERKNNNLKNSMDLLQELVDKETPMSVSKDEDDCFIYDWYCPNCDKILEKRFSIKYCYHCGQKLDWSDE